jgi:hypothetical protein
VAENIFKVPAMRQWRKVHNIRRALLFMLKFPGVVGLTVINRVL